ncbi:unnamed protein product [Closterium sp. NIES-54]
MVLTMIDSDAARGAEPAGAGTGGAEPGVPESEGAEPLGAEPERMEPRGVEPGGAESRGAESGGAELEHAEPGGAEPGGAESGGAAPRGAEPERAESGGPPSPESHPASPESHPELPVCPVCTGRRIPRPRPPPVPSTHSMNLRPSTAPQHVPPPSPPASSLAEPADPESDSLCTASPTVTRLLATVVTNPFIESTAASTLVAELVDFAAHCRLDYAASLVAESESASVCPPSIAGECALGTDVLEDRQEEFECFAPAVPHLWQAAMDAEMASSKSTGTYVNEAPPPGAKIGVDFFQTFSPTPKMTTLRVLLHVTAQRDYELHSLDFRTAYLQGSLHEEMWLFRPPGFTGSFPSDTQWSLWRPVYGLRQAPREWHDTLRTTLAALGFAPSTADPSLFLHTDATLPPFYVLVYVDDLVFATANTKALAHVKSELQKRHTCTDLGELTSYLGLRITRDRAQRTITLTLSHMVQQVLQRFGFTVLCYLCSTSSMGLVLGGRARVVLTGYADASWADDLATQRSSQGYTFNLDSGSFSWRSTRSSSVLSSSCEAEIYAGAMAPQELRWLTYLLTDLGEAPRSPPVLYVDNKAMLALCQEHRLEHRTKHIALRYFLAQELQQRGLFGLAYVASRANTADVFTKALQPCEHQRFYTVLGLVPTVPQLLTS